MIFKVIGTLSFNFILFGSNLSNYFKFSFHINNECDSDTVTFLPYFVFISYIFNVGLCLVICVILQRFILPFKSVDGIKYSSTSFNSSLYSLSISLIFIFFLLSSNKLSIHIPIYVIIILLSFFNKIFVSPVTDLIAVSIKPSLPVI